MSSSRDLNGPEVDDKQKEAGDQVAVISDSQQLKVTQQRLEQRVAGGL